MTAATDTLTVHIESLAPEADRWDALLERVRPGAEFLVPAWLRSWQQAYVPGNGWCEPLQYVCVEDADARLVGILPLARQQRFGLRMLSLAGYYMPFRDVLIDADAGARVAEHLVAELGRGRGLGLRLGPVEKSAASYAAISAALAAQGWATLELGRGELFYLELPGTLEAYLPMVRGRARKAEYFGRRLRRHGAVSLTMSNGLPVADWTGVFDDLVSIEAKSWVAERGEPRFMGSANRVFWKAVFGDPRLSAALRVWILYLDDSPVSFCLTLDSGPVRYQLVNGYAEEVRRHSTGYVIFREMILDALRNGIRRICFGQGDPGHKAEWGARPSEELVDLIAMKPGLTGRAAVAAYRSLQRWRDRR